MNLDLHVKNGILSAMPDVVQGFVVDTETERTVSPYELPSVQEFLGRIGPLPQEALVLGVAEDGLPILLNLWDPQPGPILVAGDSQSGKTNFLKTITRFAACTHHASQIQYGVITSHPHEWDGHADWPQCIGIFSAVQRNVADFIRALAAWAGMNRTSRQSVLLLIDGLDDLLPCNSGLGQDLHKILVQGPAKRVWPIVTMNLECCGNVGTWLQYFHTRVFGYSKKAGVIGEDGCPPSGFENLCRGVEFSLKEQSQWIKFRIPGM